MDLSLLVIAFVLYSLPSIASATQPSQSTSETSRFSDGALVTKTDQALQGYVKENLHASTFITCAHKCLKREWCISMNYAIQGGTRECEMNDFGVDNELLVLQDQLTTRAGFVYSQIRLPKRSSSYCSSSPCAGEATCVEETKSCLCASGYTGSTCQTDIDDCSPNPCVNGGTCVDGINGYTCICMMEFTGINCQTSLLCKFFFPQETAIINFPSSSFGSNILKLTLCTWLKLPVNAYKVAFLTYSHPNVPNILNAHFNGSKIIFTTANGGHVQMNSGVQWDNNWQHICLIWTNTAGTLKLYRNGIEIATSTSPFQGVPGGGTFYIGKGAGDPPSFAGNMTNLHMWATDYSASQIMELNHGGVCHAGPTQGDIISWDGITFPASTKVKKICPVACTSE